MKNAVFVILLFLLMAACKQDTQTKTPEGAAQKTSQEPQLIYEKEKHLANMKQLTFGGDNAEAYFSFDNKNLVFQASNKAWGADCDQIFMMPINGYEKEKVIKGFCMPPLICTIKNVLNHHVLLTVNMCGPFTKVMIFL